MQSGLAAEELGFPLLTGASGSERTPPPDECSSDVELGSTQRHGSTVVQAAFNICNIYVGTGLLCMPYALMKGGWAALAVQAVLVPIFALSGQLICSAFDRLPAHIPRTYPELGRAAAGSLGLRSVMLFSFLELFGGSCILIMVAWQQLELLLPPGGLGPALKLQHWAAGIATALLLPLLCVDLRLLSRLSVVGLTASGLVLVLVLSLPLLDPHRAAMPQQPPPGHHLLSAGIIQAIGIFALSSTAHSTLPALRTTMREPSRFPAALTASFAVMLGAYSTLAAAGYYYFGDSASPLVTADLARNSWYTAHSAVPVHRILAGVVMMNALTKYPGLNLCLQDMIFSVLPLSRDEQGSYHPPLHWAARLLRLALLTAATLLALTAYDVLGSTLSLLGGLASITCSLLLPTAFYARLAWHQLGRDARCGLLLLLAVGAALVCLITGTTLCDMSARCQAWRRAGLGGRSSLIGSAVVPWR